MIDQDIQKALRHLRRVDPVMGAVIRRAGPFTLKLRRNRFRALAFAILAQQISGKAAAAIRGRLVNYVKPQQLSSSSVSRLSAQELRSVGLSQQKAAYLLDLAQRVNRGDLRLQGMNRMSDEDVINALTQVKGIGVWTAQMFLIFSLGRLDVFPHDDLGVRVAIRNLYGLDELPNKDISHQIAAPWRPYASVASWYCWRSLEFKD